MAGRLLDVRQTPRLLGLFLAAMLLPAGALGWLGWRLIEQDRQLERQRVQDFVESTANSVTAAVERELGAIERGLGARTGQAGSAGGLDTAVTVRLTSTSHPTVLAGAPLVYEPAVAAAASDPPESTWAQAERFEFAERDPPGAVRAYRALARSPDPAVRAGALIRLARVLRRSGRPDDALDTHAALAAMKGVTILGDPADLMARWARVDLLAALDRRDALASEARSLDSDLRTGRWRLDRTAALTYADLLRPWRSEAEDAALSARIELSDAIAEFWTDWQAPPASERPGNGRRSVGTGSSAVLVVWRGGADELLLFAALPAHLSQAWQQLWVTPNVAVALVDRDGQPIAGVTPPMSGVPVVTRPAAETRLPWTLRIAATSTPADIGATGASRRRLIVAALVVLAFLIPATGYLVVRAVHKELALARQQAAFVSAVSHEFRSPLTSLAHLTSLLRSDFQPSEERRRQYYDMLASETDRLRRFVETLLDVGRMRAGTMRYRLEPVDPGPLVSGVVDEFRRHTACGAHPVRFAEPASVRRVSADAEAIGRAVWNLLENAAKYSCDGSPITVRLEEGQGIVAIRVSDQGAGIPATEEPFVFDQFFRGATATQSAVKGTGVGLAVVRHIVVAHGGDVRLDSEVGVGSTFSILLPAAPHELPGTPERRVS